MSLLACILILAIEGYIEPEYVLKSAIKLVVFFISILGYMNICGAYKILDQFKKKHENTKNINVNANNIICNIFSINIQKYPPLTK